MRATGNPHETHNHRARTRTVVGAMEHATRACPVRAGRDFLQQLLALGLARGTN